MDPTSGARLIDRWVVAMDRVLQFFLSRYIRRGTMTVTTASGFRFTCGDGTGQAVALRFVTRAAERQVLLDPELAFGEVYTEGTLIIEQGSIADVLAVALDQPDMIPRWAKLQWWLRYLVRNIQQFNPRSRSKDNVARHYDLDGKLYSLFLDSDKQYSCAYFETPESSLDDAQLAKKRHLAAKLLVANGQRILDIGSGWGGLALYLADIASTKVTGITLSREQFDISQARASEREGLRLARASTLATLQTACQPRHRAMLDD